ncbi:MAG: RluA family pseudouridine synthase [Spirochaetales bacterium]|nr:RluA family pseudouridine synthase [Spirochaetales bacterium]
MEKNIQISPVRERVLFEDNHLIIVNKLPSEIIQGDKTGDETLADKVKDYLKEKYNKPGNVFLGIVHRLDRPTSGAVIFAKTSKALSRLNNMLRNREIKKIYWAVTDAMPPDERGTLTHYLIKNQKQNKSYAHSDEIPDSKPGSLTYTVVRATDKYYLLKIELHTGRHHQIRAQLAAVGCRIKGDLKYGASRSNPGGGIHLHARELTFIHPVSKEKIDINAPAPSDSLWDIFSQPFK